MLRRPRVHAEASVMPAAPSLLTRMAQRAFGVRRTVLALVVSALVVGVVPGLGGAAAEGVGALPRIGVKLPAGPISPAAAKFTAAIDDYAEYEGQVICDPKVKYGSKLLRNLLAKSYSTPDIGISRSCSIGGQSEHKEGRALDWMVSYRTATQRAKANAFLTWLLATDKYGNKNAMARRLGVMYIGWNDHIWRSYNPDAGWLDLKGCSVNPKLAARANDTYCHRNHVHLSLSWDGAAGMTSFWDGTPSLVSPCPETWGTPAAKKSLVASVTTAQTFVPVSATRVLDTRTGLGVDQGVPCRLGQDRWSGDGRHLVVHVLDTPTVPTTGVSAVAVRIHVLSPNAPSFVTAWPTGTSRLTSRLVTVRQRYGASVTTVVPVGTDGTISLATSAGDTWVAVDVVGWVKGDATTSVAPTVGGVLHVVRATSVYDSANAAGGDLAPGETRLVTIGGVAGLPKSGIAGFNLSVTPYLSTGTVALRVFRPGDAAPSAPSASSYGAQPRTTQVITAATDAGVVAVRNSSLAAVQLRIGVSAWTGTARSATGTSMVALRPSRWVFTPGNIGSPPLRSDRFWRLPVLGHGGVPTTGVKSVLIQVTALSSTGLGELFIWPSGATRTRVPAMSLRGSVPVGDVFAVPVGADGRIQMAVGAYGRVPTITQIAAYIVGYSR